MFYTYVHCDKNGRPFYVGKGKGMRAWSHRGRNAWWKNIVEKRGLTVQFLSKNIDEELAFLCEQEAISVFRARGEILCNMTDGGEGSSGFLQPEHVKEKLRAEKSGKKRPEISGENHYYIRHPDKKHMLSKQLAKRNSERNGEKHHFYGKKRPEISGANSPNAVRIYIDVLGKEFATIGHAAEAMNISYKTMQRRIKGNPESYKVIK